MSETQDLSAQSVEIAEDGSASLIVQTTNGAKFSCPLILVEEEAKGDEAKGDEAKGDEAKGDEAKGEDTAQA